MLGCLYACTSLLGHILKVIEQQSSYHIGPHKCKHCLVNKNDDDGDGSDDHADDDADDDGAEAANG